MTNKPSDQPERLRSGGPVHRLQICPRCSGYMVPRSDVQGASGGDHWKHESRHRSFGGMKVQVFVCEKCGYVQTHQIDLVGLIDEDD